MSTSPFEDYVNIELPTKLGTSTSPIDIEAGTIPVARGMGLQFDLVDPKDIPALEGKSAYDVAIEGGFDGELADWLASLKGKDGVIGADGKTAYASAIEAGFVGSEEEFNNALANVNAGVGGGVFITDVLPTSAGHNTGDKVMSADGYSLETFTTTATDLTVKFLAITGSTNFRPVVTVNGVVATLTKHADAPLWNGTVDVVAVSESGTLNIVAVHEDGAVAKTTGTIDSAPEVIEAVLTTGYPGVQTELKKDDVMSVKVVADEVVVAYEIDNFGIFQASAGTFAAATEYTISDLKVADRGDTSTVHGFRIRVRKPSGAWSAWLKSDDYSAVELSTTAKLNNLRPIITISEVEYPTSQFGIKSGQSATLVHTIANADSYLYSSDNGTVDVVDPTAYATSKTVNYLSGSYNDITENLKVTATKASNGAVLSKGVIVHIANVAPTATITVPAARLRSGGNSGTLVQKHKITITANQSLLQDPVLNLPEGEWESAAWVPNTNRKIWTRNLLVHDDNVKGEYTFNSLLLVNGAATEGSTITGGNQGYTLGGFVFRTLSVAAYPNREAAIGTMVVDTTKLRCSNLSKGGSGTLNFTYKENKLNEVDKYTVLGGNSWYNCDAPNSTSNTSGLMTIELEEVV